MLRNCIVCGRLFKSSDENICDRCTDDADSPYIKVREYLYRHRGASVLEVSAATGVSVSNILKLINDKRIGLVGERSLRLKCPSCGDDISNDGHCLRCTDRAVRETNSGTVKSESKANNSFGNRSRRK